MKWKYSAYSTLLNRWTQNRLRTRVTPNAQIRAGSPANVRAGRMWFTHLLAWVILLSMSACKSSEMSVPTEPFSRNDQIKLMALISASSFTGEGFRASLVSTVESAFEEVLLKKGYNLVGGEGAGRYAANGASSNPTHLLEVTVSQAFVEESGTRKLLQVQLSSKVMNLAKNRVTLATSHQKSVAARHNGELLAVVRKVATELAERYPDLRSPAK